MSKYYIQQRLLSSNSRTVVKNEAGKPLFLLVGKWGTRGDVFSLYSMQGELLASIKQSSFAFSSRFELYFHHEKVGILQRLLSVHRDFYYIQYLKWAVVGNIKEHHYTVFNINQKIMEMDKEYLAIGDYYVLDIKNDEHAPLCICISAILDYWVFRRKPTTKIFEVRGNQITCSWN